MPTWVLYLLAITGCLVGLAVIVGVALLWLDRHQRAAITQRLHRVTQSLDETGQGLRRVLADFRETLAQMRWGRKL